MNEPQPANDTPCSVRSQYLSLASGKAAASFAYVKTYRLLTTDYRSFSGVSIEEETRPGGRK